MSFTIDLKKNKQTFYNLIYSLRLIKLKTLKTYIKIWPIDLCGLLSYNDKYLDCLGCTVLSSWIKQTYIIKKKFIKITNWKQLFRLIIDAQVLNYYLFYILATFLNYASKTFIKKLDKLNVWSYIKGFG